MIKKLLLLATLIISLSAPILAADNTGHFKLSLWDQAAFAIPNNPQVITGVDLGIGSYTHHITGLQWDIMWAETHSLAGVSLAFGISKTIQATGLQWAFVTKSNNITGVQLGAANTTINLTGIQAGGFNTSLRSVSGVQVGLYNQASYIHGIQFGLVNYAKYIRGLQLGIFNIAENGFLPAMVFINGHF